MEQNYQKFNNMTTTTNTLPMPASLQLSSTSIGDDESQTVRKVQLRAVTSQKDHYFKRMNTRAIRRFVIVQASASILIIICQVLLYALLQSGNGKEIDFSGIGIWGPLLFFSVAIGLSWLTTKSPTTCNVGCALGFQITTTVVSTVAVILAIISLVSHGIYVYSREDREKYFDPEIPGRIICSILILSAGTVLVLSIFVSILFCRTCCCSRHKFNESVVFDVETVK